MTKRRATYAALTGAILLACTLALAWLPYTSVYILRACSQAQDQNQCYSDHVLGVLSHRGLSTALDVFADIYASDPGYEETCHAFMHSLGKKAYEEFHKTDSVELTPKTSYCGYGFFHGFMDTLVFESNDLQEAREFCARAGKELPVPPGYTEGACYHGIGHGVSEDVPDTLWGSAEKISEQGLAVCEKLSDDNTALTRCSSGVFNAVALMYREAKYQLKTTNPFSLCTHERFSAIERSSCYDQMNTLATWMAKNDIRKAIRYTDVISDHSSRVDAIHGLTALFAHILWVTRSPDPARTISEACHSVPPEYLKGCIDGVVAGAFEFGAPGAEYTGALEICASPALNEDDARECTSSAIRNTLERFGRTKTAEICMAMSERLRPASCDSL